MRVPPLFDEAMAEPPEPKKPPEPGSDAYYEAFSNENDEHPIGVPRRRRPPSGPLD